MINAQVKVINTDWYSELERQINDFLKTIDVRQIIKTEYSSSVHSHVKSFSVIIYYVEIEDVRDLKIDNDEFPNLFNVIEIK
jgi:hypothetical protein